MNVEFSQEAQFKFYDLTRNSTKDTIARIEIDGFS